MELSPEDKYQLFKIQMDADRKALEARKAQQEVQRLLLELEHRYGFLADGATLDPRTGTTYPQSEPRKLNGKISTDALMMAITGES